MWQNRLNYSDSNALVIAIQPVITHCTSNGTTHWSVGSPPDTTTVQQDRSRFTSPEGEFTITVQLINLMHRYTSIITNLVQLKIKLIQTVFKLTSRIACPSSQRKEKNTRLHTSRRLTPYSALGLVSPRRVTTSWGRIPLHGPAMWKRSWQRRTICRVLKDYTWKCY
jgi:hypothetical protein